MCERDDDLPSTCLQCVVPHSPQDVRQSCKLVVFEQWASPSSMLKHFGCNVNCRAFEIGLYSFSFANHPFSGQTPFSPIWTRNPPSTFNFEPFAVDHSHDYDDDLMYDKPPISSYPFDFSLPILCYIDNGPRVIHVGDPFLKRSELWKGVKALEQKTSWWPRRYDQGIYPFNKSTFLKFLSSFWVRNNAFHSPYSTIPLYLNIDYPVGEDIRLHWCNETDQCLKECGRRCYSEAFLDDSGRLKDNYDFSLTHAVELYERCRNRKVLDDAVLILGEWARMKSAGNAATRDELLRRWIISPHLAWTDIDKEIAKGHKYSDFNYLACKFRIPFQLPDTSTALWTL